MHVHFSNLWQAFASRGLPAIAELLALAYPGFCVERGHENRDAEFETPKASSGEGNGEGVFPSPAD